VTGINEAGRAEEGEVELWLDGPVDTTAPAVVDRELEIQRCDQYVSVTDLGNKLPDLLNLFVSESPFEGISDRAELADDVEVGSNVDIGPCSTVGSEVIIEDGATIYDNVSIHPGTRIGPDVTLRSGVRVECPARLGRGTTIHANTVIGADGYGYEQEEGRHRKMPQVGKVVIGKDVEIGACVTIDRAVFGETVIGQGTKIDNHVHIAHNNKIGDHCLIVAMSGTAGSVTMGDYVTMAAQTGVKDHVEIADRVTVGGRGGVTKDIMEQDVVVSGYPARPHRDMIKQKAVLRRLPEMKRQLDDLKSTVESLSEGSEDS
jgi:UDP-3-O-[3-hydroxymyristoyl] glucosamine N-acyltransferase